MKIVINDHVINKENIKINNENRCYFLGMAGMQEIKDFPFVNGVEENCYFFQMYYIVVLVYWFCEKIYIFEYFRSFIDVYIFHIYFIYFMI